MFEKEAEEYLIPTQKDYFITNKGGYVPMSSVIAWKYIELPKEGE